MVADGNRPDWQHRPSSLEQELSKVLHMGPVYPENPIFREPERDLAPIGVPDVSQPEIRSPSKDRCAECLWKVGALRST